MSPNILKIVDTTYNSYDTILESRHASPIEIHSVSFFRVYVLSAFSPCMESQKSCRFYFEGELYKMTNDDVGDLLI